MTATLAVGIAYRLNVGDNTNIGSTPTLAAGDKHQHWQPRHCRCYYRQSPATNIYIIPPRYSLRHENDCLSRHCRCYYRQSPATNIYIIPHDIHFGIKMIAYPAIAGVITGNHPQLTSISSPHDIHFGMKMIACPAIAGVITGNHPQLTSISSPTIFISA